MYNFMDLSKALLPKEVWWGMAPGIATPYSFLICTDIFFTLFSGSSVPKNTSACFVTQSLSQIKIENSFIELLAMALIEKCNTLIWVIGPAVTHEMCAVGDRPRMDLSVHGTFIQLLQCREPVVCRSSPSHPRLVPIPPDCRLPAACRTPEKLHSTQF